MRRQIQRLAKEQFDYDNPAVEFSEEKVSFRVTEEGSYAGSFSFSCEEGRTVRGVVYSQNDRMECLTPQFEGQQVRIRYCFHAKGLAEGDGCEGEFAVLCCGGRYTIPFSAAVVGSYPDSSMGKIANLQEFTSLAREHWEEAYQLFYHKNFTHLFRKNEERERLLYEGLTKNSPSSRSMEEFLVGIHKKDPITLRVDETDESFSDLTQPVQKNLHLHKDSWGYCEIDVSSDAPFITFEKTRFTQVDFLGSGCSIPYLIDTNRMHAGKNFAEISLRSSYQTLVVTVTAQAAGGEEADRKSQRVLQEHASLLKLYKAYRLGEIVNGVWVNESVDILDDLTALLPDEPMYALGKAHAYLMGRQRQEAEWILSDFKHGRHGRNDPVYGYYLYLCTFLEREPSYVDRLTREIEAIFRENPDSVLLFWILTNLREEYCGNAQEKFRAIGRWIANGSSTPVLYLEAYDLLRREPYLLRQMGQFERLLCLWMRRQGCLIPELADQIFTVIKSQKNFDKTLWPILVCAYETSPKSENLAALCTYLIRGRVFCTSVHSWYEQAVSAELKVTGLYEAYLLSLDPADTTDVPKIIKLYFQYRSNLPYQSLALLYHTIITHRSEDPVMYADYIKTIGRFSLEQANLGHIDDELAAIYANMLQLGFLDEDTAKNFSRILFSHKLYVFSEDIKRVCILERELSEMQIVPVKDHVAYFHAYCDHYVILLEDADGHRFADGLSYSDQPLFDQNQYLTKCMAYTPYELPYLLAYFGGNAGKVSRADAKRDNISLEEAYGRLIGAREVSQPYKAELAAQMLPYCQDRPDAKQLLFSVIREVDVSYLEPDARLYLTDLLAQQDLYEAAWELVTEYGIDQIGIRPGRILAESMIDSCGGEEDETLLRLCMRQFLAYKETSSDACGTKIMQYLCTYYEGSTDRMFSLWKTADAYGLFTYELQERILIQMLYEDRLILDSGPLFEKYYQSGGEQLVVLAYLTYRSHNYFRGKEAGEQSFFDTLESRYLYHMELNTSCRLALLRHLSQLKTLSRAQRTAAEELLAEFTRQNMYFAFYKNFSPDLIKKFFLYDKVILEYHTQPGTHVTLHYCRDEDGDRYIDEDMTQVYDGVYVKMFVMFFGEMTRYYISEHEGNRMIVTENSRLLGSVSSCADGRRYDRMNRMLASAALDEKEDLQQDMRTFWQLDEMTQTAFLVL